MRLKLFQREETIQEQACMEFFPDGLKGSCYFPLCIVNSETACIGSSTRLSDVEEQHYLAPRR